jgi:hypothetical protein
VKQAAVTGALPSQGGPVKSRLAPAGRRNGHAVVTDAQILAVRHGVPWRGGRAVVKCPG